MGAPVNTALDVFRSSNFAPAFFLLPPKRRRALQAVYAFCRAVDDAVDQPGPQVPEGRQAGSGGAVDQPGPQVLEGRQAGSGGAVSSADRRAALNVWRERLRNPALPADGMPDAAVWSALRETIAAFQIDPRHLLDLTDGVERDLSAPRYRTFEELKTYCYGVASTVGLACLPIFGLDEPRHRDFAVNLGLAVQLTNILRDVAADAREDRIYLPREDMERFGVAEADLRMGVLTPALAALLDFEAGRARGLYAAARAALPEESLGAARPALVMGGVYRELLAELERRDFDVFAGRARLSPARKLMGIWRGLRGKLD